MAWTAELTNDPEKGYALCIDLWEGEEHRGRIERDATGELALRVYGETVVPAGWLAKLLTQAQDELINSGRGAR
ncbi:MAG: hypothetical protein IPK74_28705 [Deltaproteobacteria bacterium]|nr:hypothetical protein [Deltaproteobacteria bacterium]